MEIEVLKTNIDRFIQHKNRNWKPNTLRNNLYYFGGLKAYLNDRDFNRDNLEEYLFSLKGRSTNSIKQAERCILAFITWLYDEGIIEKNWGKRIERTRVQKVPRILPTQKEVLKLIDQVTEFTKYDNVLTKYSKLEHRACLKFIIVCSGTRNYETRMIKRKDVSLTERQIQIKEGKTGERIISIPPIPWLIDDITKRVNGDIENKDRVLKDLGHYKEDYSDLLFVVNATRLEALMRKVGSLCGISMTVHDLRRICLRDLKRNGAGIDDIKNVAGHKNIETTLGYLSYDTESQERTLKNFSSEARKFRTKEEKAKELINTAWNTGRVVEDHFDGEYVTMKVKVI